MVPLDGDDIGKMIPKAEYHVSRKVDLSLIAGYAQHILSLPLSFFEMRQVGEILSRCASEETPVGAGQ